MDQVKQWEATIEFKVNQFKTRTGQLPGAIILGKGSYLRLCRDIYNKRAVNGDHADVKIAKFMNYPVIVLADTDILVDVGCVGWVQ